MYLNIYTDDFDFSEIISRVIIAKSRINLRVTYYLILFNNIIGYNNTWDYIMLIYIDDFDSLKIILMIRKVNFGNK